MPVGYGVLQRLASLAVRLAQMMVIEARLRLTRQQQQQQQLRQQQQEAERNEAEALHRYAAECLWFIITSSSFACAAVSWCQCSNLCSLCMSFGPFRLRCLCLAAMKSVLVLIYGRQGHCATPAMPSTTARYDWC